jgi:3D (Asp-Asp-Asp) domain-containing protein
VTLGGAERSSGSTPDVAAQRGEPEPRGRSTVRDAAAVDRAAGAAVDLALSIDDGLGRTARVGERIEVSEENVPQQMLHRDDAEVDIGQTRVIYPGIPGRVQRTFWIREEYGAEVERRLVQETVLEAAVPGVIGHGTRPLTLETPEGVVRYARTLAVKATYYTPANGGKAPGDPWYGITATGARATRGIIAVDPRVIPMYSWVYVPGYGIAQARDVGSAIIGNHIDVCFDDGDGAWWGTRYLTVYLLVR